MDKPDTKPLTRGDATRESLIQAALAVFGRDGFHAASTRAIAEAAAVNQALIGYHFGGKEGLYLAVFEDIAERINQRLGPLATAVEHELDSDGGATRSSDRNRQNRRERDLLLLHRLTDAFAAMLVAEESAGWARLIIREQQEPSSAFDVLYRKVMGRLLGLVTRLVARSCDTSPDDTETRLLALTIIGQALIFRAGRAAVLRHQAWTEINEAELAAIQARIRRNVTAILGEELDT